MIYIDREYLEMKYMGGEDEIRNSQLFSNPEDVYPTEFTISEDTEFDQDDYDSKSDEFAESYVKQVLSITFDFYPQLRSKSKKLKEELFTGGEFLFDKVYDIYKYYIDGDHDCHVEKDCPGGININEVDSFIRNPHFDYLLDNYEEWFKQKVSYENIYVESVYAGVYINTLYSMLLKMLYNYSPTIFSLPDEQLDEIQFSFTGDAWSIYCMICLIDPDTLSDSTVLDNLEDYEFDDLLNYKGPEIIRNEKGKIVCICIHRNKLKPEKLPLLCRQCTSFINTEERYFLCSLNRHDQKNSLDFKCRAYEKFCPDVEE